MGQPFTTIKEVHDLGLLSFRGAIIDKYCHDEPCESIEIPSTTEDYNDDER